MRAKLLLEDGTRLTGVSFGAEKKTLGEVVFHTGMTGYQEILTNPSFCGLIVTLTNPLIGNCGMNQKDAESQASFIKGLVVREFASVPSHWRSEKGLERWLKEYDIPGIAGVDTRMLTRKIRMQGSMKGIISTQDTSWEELEERLGVPLREDLVSIVSSRSIHTSPNYGKRVVLMDFGAKYGLQRDLAKRGCEVVVVPWNTSAEKIHRLDPDGILLSNGPGDPKNVPEGIQTIQKLLGHYPLFGIGLGHQLLALACGGDTQKMMFGHWGSNHPVKDLGTGQIYMTPQHHSYTVREESLKNTCLEITHIALNDGTCEGLSHREFPAFSVQYHPEAAPGPWDSGHLFDQFMDLMESSAQKEGMSHA